MAPRSFATALKIVAMASASALAMGAQAQARQSQAQAPSTTTATTATPSTPAPGAVSPYYGNLKPFYGNLRPFYGNLRPFYGNLRPFYGNLRPFWGNLKPFWGNLKPFADVRDPSFWGSLSGYIDANKRYDGAQVAAFWETQGAKYNSILTAWSSASTSADYANVAQMLQGVVGDASAFWGDEVTKATKAKTFDDGFANAFLAKHGIDLSDPSSLANIDQNDAAMFFLDWYDNLMSFSGAGHVDWWMGATGWSPALAQTEGDVGGGAKPVTIGMLDFAVLNGGKAKKGTVLQYGSDVFGDGHGAAVGSLIMSSLDGSNIMGVMPAGDATIDVYDPYDSTGTTNWTDVGKGIDTLTSSYFNKGTGKTLPLGLSGAIPLVNSLLSNGIGPIKIAPAGAALGVINASLGEPGWTLSPGWNGALASGSAKYSVLVVAAGNEGVTQPSNIAWNFAVNPTLIVVGSVGLDGTISNFSNTPGEACLTDTAGGGCDKLKNHFLVAPGELILVSDGQGGISRQTGTSLAAPLVTGAIGLLEARWPWLSNYPDETAQIILQSATPIHSADYTGSGPDPVYGWGELNIAASQSPLNWNNLVFLQSTKGLLSLPIPVSASRVMAEVRTGNQASWDSSRLYFTAFEKVGNTFRDFEIPMASSLVGQNVSTLAGRQLFQSYLTSGLQGWVKGGAKFGGAKGYDPATAHFMDSSAQIGQFGDMELRARFEPGQATYGFRQDNRPVDMDFALVGDRRTLSFGFGDGASALSGQPGLSGPADFQIGRGGANPLLGLASGGAYVDWRMSVLKGLSVNFGATQRRSERDYATLTPLQRNSPAAVYSANAEHVGLDYAAGKRLVLHAGLTQLREDSGLLGIQSLQPAALQNGSVSRAASFGVDYKLTKTLSLSASGTVAKTSTVGLQGLTTAQGGLTSTAAEIAISKARVFDKNDRLRLTLSKPMQVVAGALQYTDYAVTNRQTGAVGPVVETANVATGRTPFAAELYYGRLLPSQSAEAAVFVHAGVDTGQFGPVNQTDYMVGYRYRMVF